MTDALTALNVLASDPLLRWQAIADHARDHHGVTWPDDHAARKAITGAFGSISPTGCDYDPDGGTITNHLPAAPPGAVPLWGDPQLLKCAVAALAAAGPGCDLQDIYGETLYVSGPRDA